jgi:hypothetical protein
VATYSRKDLEQISDSIGSQPSEVLRYKGELENAARWYRLHVPPAQRQARPPWELPKQLVKEPIEGTEPRKRGKRNSQRNRSLSQLHKKARQVEAAAKKLLLHLGVRRLEESPDGPGDRELLIFLASYGGFSEEHVIDATDRIGRLGELLEAIRAAAFLKTCAFKSAQEAFKFAKLLPKGNHGDMAVIGWIADMMSLYEKITGREARFSVRGPGIRRGQPTGPFLRFVQAAGKSLGIDLSPASARSRQRALKNSAHRRQK